MEVAVALAQLVPELLEQLVEPDDPHAGEVGALAQQPVHRLADVVRVREVFAELAEDLVRVQANALSAVPAGVADGEHAQPLYTVLPPARSLLSLRCTCSPSSTSSLAAAMRAGLSNGPSAVIASRRPGIPRMPSRYSAEGMRSETSTPPPPSKYSITRFSESTSMKRSNTFSTARLVRRSTRSLAFFSSPAYSSSILPAVEARTACRSVRRGTISRSPQRTARFSALARTLS